MINELSYADFYGFMVLSQNLNKAEEMIHIPELNLLKHMLSQEIKTEKTHWTSNLKAFEQDDNQLRMYGLKLIPAIRTLAFYFFISLNDFRIPGILKNTTLYKKCSFPLRISSVNGTRSAVSFRFSHIYWRNP